MTATRTRPSSRTENPSHNDSDGFDRGRQASGQSNGVTQAFGTVMRFPIGLEEGVRRASAAALNDILADVLTLRDLYKKHHWQTAGPTFYQLHLLFDKHFNEQSELVDQIAERIQMLGGVSIAMPHDVVERTHIPRPPVGREAAPAQLARLLAAHEIVLMATRQAALEAAAAGDDGTNDLLVSGVIRTNEMQVWFLAATSGVGAE